MVPFDLAPLELFPWCHQSLNGTTFPQNCIAAYNTIENGSIGDCSSMLDQFKQECHDMFPLATIFQLEKPAVEEPIECNSNEADHKEICNGPTEKRNDGDDIME